MYYFDRCSSELAQLIPLPFSRGRSTCYCDRLHDFSVTIPKRYKDAYVNSFFPPTTRLWNYLSIKCFTLSSDLNGFKSTINRHILNLDFFLKDFLCVSFSCNSMHCSGCSALHGVNPN